MEVIATRLGDSGLCIVPQFLNSETIQAVLLDLKALKTSGQFTRAGTGQGNTRQIQDRIRRDEVFWLDEVLANLVQQQLWDNINALKQALNRVLFLGLNEFEGHYASYPKGGFYKRHKDSFQRDQARKVSVILYLNEFWQAQDGGLLRIYEKGGSTDVEPMAGTLVCFLSHDLEHEVLLSHKVRFSFSGWFKN